MRPSATICSHLFLLFLFPTPTACFAWPAKVTSISDGDTIIVLHSGHHEKIRLYGIDTPEKNQDYGQKAEEITSTLIAGRNVEVETKDVDQYGRTVGLVSVDGHSLNELLIQNGFAWVYRQYCKEHFCYDWIQLEGKARWAKKGLWADQTLCRRGIGDINPKSPRRTSTKRQLSQQVIRHRVETDMVLAAALGVMAEPIAHK